MMGNARDTPTARMYLWAGHGAQDVVVKDPRTSMYNGISSSSK